MASVAIAAASIAPAANFALVMAPEAIDAAVIAPEPQAVPAACVVLTSGRPVVNVPADPPKLTTFKPSCAVEVLTAPFAMRVTSTFGTPAVPAPTALPSHCVTFAATTVGLTVLASTSASIWKL
jgi:hypothetical protein